MPKRDTGLKVFPDHNIVSFSDIIDKQENNIRVSRCPKAFDSALMSACLKYDTVLVSIKNNKIREFNLYFTYRYEFVAFNI